MTVRSAKRGKSSHEQRRVGAAGGNLFAKAISGRTITVRGAAGGILTIGKKKKPKLARPGFEHTARRGR